MRGRSHRSKKNREIILSILTKGLSYTAAAKKAKMPRRCLYDWRADDAEFDAACIAAEDEGTEALEDEVLRRAMHGVDKPVFHKGEVVGSIKEYSDNLAMFTLKGRRPEKYRDRYESTINATVKTDGATDMLELARRIAFVFAAGLAELPSSSSTPALTLNSATT